MELWVSDIISALLFPSERGAAITLLKSLKALLVSPNIELRSDPAER